MSKVKITIYLALISLALFGGAGVASAAEVCEMLSRSSAVLNEPMRPFKSDSIWNRTIPAGSTYAYVQDAIFGDPDSTPIYVSPDLVSICYSDPNEPMINITRNVGWSYPERSQDTGNVQYSRRLSATDCGCVNWKKNGNQFFVLIDSITKLADLGVGAWRLEGGPLLNHPPDGMGAHNLDVVDGYGIRTYGRASQLSAMGGMIRPGELQTGIKHAVAVSMEANRYSSVRHYVWPAFSADSFAPAVHKGTNEHYTMGTLLAIPPTINLDTMTWKTVQGLNLARAAQQYGWYIADTSSAFKHSWSIAFEDEAARFDLGGYIDPVTGFFKVNSSKINDADLSSDLNQILKNLSAVTSNVPTDTVAPMTTASPASGTFSSAQKISLVTNEPATTLYSMDGGATIKAYKQPINISQTTTLMFYSMDSMGNKENFKTNTYKINSSDTTPRNICTADAKLCPDGTFVGRTGKNCEFVCGTGVATTTTNTPTENMRMEKRIKEMRIEIEKKRANIKDEQQKRRLEIARKQTELVNKRLEAAIKRVQKLSDRVAERLTKLEAEGVTTTVSRGHLVETKTKLDEARTKAVVVKLAIEIMFANITAIDTANTTPETTPKNAIKEVQEAVKEATKIIQEAHKHVALAVSIVKPGLNKPRHATTTPDTYQSRINSKTFYVSNFGNDANDGLTPKTAWQTLAKVNAMQYDGTDTDNTLGKADPKKLYKNSKFDPGTRVLFKRGDKWREKLFILSSGTKENPVSFGAYGDGPSPIITGFECISAKCDAKYKWSRVQGSIYSIVLEKSVRGKEALFYGKKYVKDTTSEDAGVVTEDGKYLTFVPFSLGNPTDYSKMKAGSFLFNYKTNMLYLWTFDGDVPDDHNIEVSVRDVGIKLKASEHLIVKDLEVSGATTDCVGSENIHNTIFDNLHIHSCGGAWQERFFLGNGMTIYHNSSDVIVQNSKFHDVYDSAVSPQIFYFDGQLIQNITIRNNEMYNAPLSVVEVTSFAKNSRFRNIIIENNRIYNKGVSFSQKYQTNRLIGGPGILVLIDPVSVGSKAENVHIRNNNISGMLLDAIAIGFISGTADVSGNTLKDNAGAGVIVYDNSKDANTSVEIKNNIIVNNGAGILFDTRMSNLMLSGNTMQDNGVIDLVAQAKKYYKVVGN